jgi:hypothetical protein
MTNAQKGLHCLLNKRSWFESKVVCKDYWCNGSIKNRLFNLLSSIRECCLMVSIRALEACGPGSNPGSLTNPVIPLRFW